MVPELALLLSSGTRNEIPLDKVNVGSGNEIACEKITGIYIMDEGHVKASIFIDENGD